MCDQRPLIILGVGNLLRSDDGFGIHVVRELDRTGGLPGALAIDAGVAILDMLPWIEQADRVLVIDAVAGHGKPGTVYSFDVKPDAMPAPWISVHSMGLLQALRTLQAPRPVPPMTVIGVEPANLEYGLELSEPVQQALPDVVTRVREIVQQRSAVTTSMAGRET